MTQGSRLTVGITGSSGLLGTALASALRESGHQVVRYVRRAPQAADERRYEPGGAGLDVSAVADVDAVVNLAGAGIGDRRWTDSYKQTLVRSRLDATGAVVTALQRAHKADGKTRRLLSASGVDAYADTGATAVAEDGPLGDTFLGDLCRQWEDAALAAGPDAASVAVLRTGLVTAAEAPFITRQKWLFKLGVGGRLGNGSQYWPLVSAVDHVAAQLFLLADERGRELTGPVNLTGPVPVTNAEVTREMGRLVHRPTLTFVPGFALKVAIGEFAETILASHRVLPGRLADAGFAFAHPDVRSILATAL